MFKDKAFMSDIVRIALPITLQSVIMSLLTMTDQLMVGQLGEVAIASVGISAKLTSIVSVVLAGLASGISIYCAQYWGRGDTVRIRHLLGFGLGVGLLFAGGLALVVGARPQLAMSPFTTDPRVFAEGAIFVQLLAISYLPSMLTMITSAVLRSTGEVKLPMYASTSAVVLNVVLNYLLEGTGERYASYADHLSETGRVQAKTILQSQREALLHELTADAEDSLMAADSISDIDERICDSDSIMMRTVGFSIWQAHESELESAEDFERVHIARTIEQLVERSEVIQRALAEDRLMITGARYQLDTGKVEVLSF